jgi:hypothetical protein
MKTYGPMIRPQADPNRAQPVTAARSRVGAERQLAYSGSVQLSTGRVRRSRAGSAGRVIGPWRTGIGSTPPPRPRSLTPPRRRRRRRPCRPPPARRRAAAAAAARAVRVRVVLGDGGEGDGSGGAEALEQGQAKLRRLDLPARRCRR